MGKSHSFWTHVTPCCCQTFSTAFINMKHQHMLLPATQSSSRELINFYLMLGVIKPATE